MRITSVIPQVYAGNLKRQQTTQLTHQNPNLINEKPINSLNFVAPAYIEHLAQRGGVGFVNLTFTGADKNINQFASYSPENKRYGLNSYNYGGLGVVAQEAPNNWRIKEKADVRDFSPYHSYGTTKGGVMVAEVTRDEKGKITERHLPQNKFHQAAQNESLEEVAKRLNLKPENLEYVIQIEPDTKGKSEFVVLKDAKASGSFKRASDNAVDELKEINYRFFGTDEISDPVFIAQKKLEAKTRDEIIEPRLAKIKEQIEATYHYEQN